MSDIVERLRAKELLSIEEDGYTHFLPKNPDGDDGADEIIRLRAENEKLLADTERLCMMLKEKDFELERLRQSYIPFMEKHNELRDAVKQLFRDRTFATFEQNLSWLKRYIEQ